MVFVFIILPPCRRNGKYILRTASAGQLCGERYKSPYEKPLCPPPRLRGGKAEVYSENLNIPIGEILEEACEVFVVDGAVAVDIERALVYFNVPVGKVLEQTC